MLFFPSLQKEIRKYNVGFKHPSRKGKMRSVAIVTFEGYNSLLTMFHGSYVRKIRHEACTCAEWCDATLPHSVTAHGSR